VEPFAEKMWSMGRGGEVRAARVAEEAVAAVHTVTVAADSRMRALPLACAGLWRSVSVTWRRLLRTLRRSSGAWAARIAEDPPGSVAAPAGRAFRSLFL